MADRSGRRDPVSAEGMRGTADRPERLTARVTGRVQGVGFRWWIRRRADGLGLTGWVMNADDERAVEVVAEGPSDALDRLETSLRAGPSGARVDAVDARRGPASGEWHGFEIVRS